VGKLLANGAVRAILVCVAAILLAVLTVEVSARFLSAPATVEAAAGGVKPARLDAVEGTKLKRVTLTADAVRRLDVQTGPIRTGPGGLLVAYSALVYDPAGKTWVYTNPEPLVFVREPVTVAVIRGADAVLAAGPAAGTVVVQVGAAELYGTELGVGK
jgi:hypothetical protein